MLLKQNNSGQSEVNGDVHGFYIFGERMHICQGAHAMKVSLK